jgi:hypothetical protein
MQHLSLAKTKVICIVLASLMNNFMSDPSTVFSFAAVFSKKDVTRPSKHFGTFMLLCCWHIWKRRNNAVFREDRLTITGALTACKSEAFLWKARLPKKDKEIADAWCSILATAM